MRKRLASILFVGGAAAAAIAIATPSAFASGGTWTVSPGGSYTASVNSGTTAILEDGSLQVDCTVSTASGTLNDPPSGTLLGTITSINWSNCSGLGGIVSSGTATGNASTSNPWDINGTAYNSAVDGGQTQGTITAAGTGVGATLNLTILGSACTAVVGGASASAPASAVGVYDNTPGLLATTGTTGLTVTSSDCSGMNAGDSVTFFTSPTSTVGSAITNGYAVSTHPTITDP